MDDQKRVAIRKFGNLLEISTDNKQLSKDVRNVLEPVLSYTYQQKLYGIDRRDPITGIERNFRFEDRQLFRYDLHGRMVCGAGLHQKITKTLTENGYQFDLKRLTHLGTGSKCYEPDWDAVVSTFSFRARQDECLCAIHDNEYGVIDAATGFGKGIIICMICMLYPNAKIHIVIRRKDIVAKTVAILTKYFPSVGQIGGGVHREGNRITVFTADSLHHSDGDADILLCDEAHELLTPIASRELARYTHSRNFAFTASPEGRMDNADAKLESLFGPKIFQLSYIEAVSLGLVVPIEVHWLSMKMDHNPAAGKKDVPKKRWGLWRNVLRNQKIAEKARSFGNDQVLILVETVEHAVHLGKLLPEYQLCYAEMSKDDLEMYKKQDLLPDDYVALDPKNRDKLRREFEAGTARKVIATDVWSTGVDFVGLQVLIRADARSSDIMDVQAPGRVCRIGQKEVGILVDCLDEFDPGLNLKARGRMRNYKEKGWEQILPNSFKKKKAGVKTNVNKKE